MSNNTGIFQEFTTNVNGVRIKKCCSSCRHSNPFDNGPRRVCGLSKKKVDKSDLCSGWKISEMINKIKVNGIGCMIY